MGHRCPIQVQIVKVPGYRFLTIDETHPIWTDASSDQFLDLSGVRFVRVRPPVDATDEMIEQVCRLSRVGHTDVQVLNRSRPQTVLNQSAVERHMGIREVVEEMVKEANTKDRGALEQAVQEQLSGVGL